MARRRIGGDEGAGLIEYALLLMLIGVISIGALSFAGDEVKDVFQETGLALADDPQTQGTELVPAVFLPDNDYGDPSLSYDDDDDWDDDDDDDDDDDEDDDD